MEFYFDLSVIYLLAVQDNLLEVLKGLSVCFAPACVLGTISMLLPDHSSDISTSLLPQPRIWRCE